MPNLDFVSDFSAPLFEQPESADELYRRQFSWSARFWKGRVALFAILRALGIGPGDSVLVPGYTCVVVPSAVQFVGAKPVYVDIEADGYNIGRKTVEEAYNRALESGQRPPRAVIIQHTYGIPPEVGPLFEFAREHRLFVIEDCCHALGSRVRFAESNIDEEKWHYAGTLGDAAFFSSQWSKPVVSGLGGWAVAKSAQTQGRLWQIEGELRDPTVVSALKLGVQVAAYWMVVRPSFYWTAIESYRFLSSKGLVISSSDNAEWRGGMPHDYKKTMSYIQSKLIKRGLEDINEYIAHRRQLRELYDSALAAEGLDCLSHSERIDPVLLRYPIRVPNKQELLKAARDQRIELGDWFNHPLHPAGWDLSALGWIEGQCPNSEIAARDVINLPMHERIGEKQLHKTVDFLAKALGATRGSRVTRPVAAPVEVSSGPPQAESIEVC